MRVIAGRSKGRRLETPPGPGVRPVDGPGAGGFVFLLGGGGGARVLDLYAGTGSPGR